eukprot:2027046-Amphidinium_carterae.1
MATSGQDTSDTNGSKYAASMTIHGRTAVATPAEAPRPCVAYAGSITIRRERRCISVCASGRASWGRWCSCMATTSGHWSDGRTAWLAFATLAVGCAHAPPRQALALLAPV